MLWRLSPLSGLHLECVLQERELPVLLAQLWANTLCAQLVLRELGVEEVSALEAFRNVCCFIH